MLSACDGSFRIAANSRVASAPSFSSGRALASCAGAEYASTGVVQAMCVCARAREREVVCVCRVGGGYVNTMCRVSKGHILQKNEASKL